MRPLKRNRTIKTADVRKSFLEYFTDNDHKLVPSSPVIPFDDPTILFANAGMNQFKEIFTGRRRADYPRATSSQKCIRAGGKHNDLDNVGFTARHHTFFEMLGNFSFGDYFKEEAIRYAWEWVTKVLLLPKDRLYATVFDDDDEAFELWAKIAPELKNGQILRFGVKDNYWSMGDVGPCGPCSEIHYDRGEKFGAGPDDLVNGEGERFVEIWNLVFMQFDQNPEGEKTALPKPSVDTGAGLERIAAIMQGVESNYHIDLFQNIIAAISDETKSSYEKNVASHHVVADHLRALTFAIADGAGISNEGRGYVLRRILRRAARHGRNLGAKEPFIYRLVPVLVAEMGDAFPEIRDTQHHVMNVIKAEEESFDRTLETGLEQFEKAADSLTGDVIPGVDVFRLYDTYGFPYDLTEILANERGFSLDKNGFEREMYRQQTRSRKVGTDKEEYSHLVAALNLGQHRPDDTIFVRDGLSVSARVVDFKAVGSPSDDGNPAFLVLSDTPFYVEAGGQISDTGVIRADSGQMSVEGASVHMGKIVHWGAMRGDWRGRFVRDSLVTVEVDTVRRWDIMRNHTATHLAHAALRKVLGEHVKQSGSYVGPDRLRFDFSHHQPMTSEEIMRVEEMVNEQILDGATVSTVEMPAGEAKKSGAMALFGETYGDIVRVVSVGSFSRELCGGTHVQTVAQIGPFFIIQETGVASGVRRLEAITGREAHRYMLAAKRFRSDVGLIVGRPEAEAKIGVQQLKESNTALQKELKKVKEAMFSGAGPAVGNLRHIGPVQFITHDFGVIDRDSLGAWIDKQKADSAPLVAVALGIVGDRVTVMVAASGSAVKDYRLHAGTLAKRDLPKFGGRGGGKPTFAQGGVAAETDPQALFRVIGDSVSLIMEGENE